MKSPSFRWVVLATSLAFVVAQLDVSIVNLALPQIGSAFGAGISTLQWVVDSYTLAFAVLMLSAGSISDRLGSRRIFQLGIVIFGLASAGCAFAPNGMSLVIARIIQGVGAAMMIPSSLALLNGHFSHQPKVRARAVGLWTAAGSAAMAAGPTIGGLLIELANWRFIFMINIPICLAGFLLSFKLHDGKAKSGNGKFDWAGQLSWTFGITALIAAIIEGPKWGFGNPLVIMGLAFFLMMFLVFLRIERKVSRPVLPLYLFKSNTFNTLLMVGAVLNFSYYGSVFVLSLYLQKVLGYTSLSAGLAFIPLTAGFVLSNVASARIISRYGTWKPILFGLGLFTLGFAGLFVAGPATPYWQLFLPFLVISTGMGLAVPAMINGILGNVDKQLSGTASAILTTSRQTAGAIGVAVFGAMAAGNGYSILHCIYKASAVSIVVTITALIMIYRIVRKQNLNI